MCKTIKHTVKFQTSPHRIYQWLAESKHHTALTGEKAQISRRVGGKFSTRGGRVTGVNVDLVPGERLVQAWRSKDFPVGIYSMATFLLSPSRSGGTQLVLIHRGVPKHLIPKVDRDWRKFYWQEIQKIIRTQKVKG